MDKLNVEGFIYLVLLILITAFFVSSSIKNKDKNIGSQLLELEIERVKFLIASILALLCLIPITLLIITPFSVVVFLRSLFWIIVVLIICYNITKKRIITEKGVGFKNIFGKANSNSIIKWSNITDWRWLDDKKILIFDVNFNGSILKQRWRVESQYRNDVDKYFKRYSGK